MYGQTPTAAEQVKEITRKFNERVWVIRNLIRAGWKRQSTLKIYKTVLRPALEFANVIYGPLLNSGQTAAIERLQKRCLRMIYGWEKSYETLLQESNLTTLEERRKERIDRFACKSERNQLVNYKWYLPNENRKTGRKFNKYIEPKVRTARQTTNPVYHYSKRLNQLNRM